MQKLSCSLIVIFFVGFWVLSAWSDYTWEERYLGAKGNNALVFSKQANVIDPLYFYTLFVTPVTRIGFVLRSDVVKKGDDVYFVREIWANKEIGGDTTEEEFRYFIDCKNKKDGWLYEDGKSENAPSADIDQSRVRWSSRDDESKAKRVMEEECKLLARAHD